jgi:hypothetical protein
LSLLKDSLQHLTFSELPQAEWPLKLFENLLQTCNLLETISIIGFSAYFNVHPCNFQIAFVQMLAKYDFIIDTTQSHTIILQDPSSIDYYTWFGDIHIIKVKKVLMVCEKK